MKALIRQKADMRLAVCVIWLILVYLISKINPSPAEPVCPAFANSVDPDQLASEEAN